MRNRALSLLSVSALLLLLAPSAQATGRARSSTVEDANAYRIVKLVSDQAGAARNLDPGLVNAWGLVAGPTTPWWVADNHTDLSTIYDHTGAAIPLVVSVADGPTGTVFNAGSDFAVHHGGFSGP